MDVEDWVEALQKQVVVQLNLLFFLDTQTSVLQDKA